MTCYTYAPMAPLSVFDRLSVDTAARGTLIHYNAQQVPPPLLENFDALRWLGHVARMHRDKLPRILLMAWVYMPKGIKTEFKL